MGAARIPMPGVVYGPRVAPMANQHSVSQFLTRPWQRRPDPERKLVYYNFDTDKIEEEKARLLFAREDVHSEEIDLRFGDLIEAPLGRFWNRVQKDGVIEITDWAEIRAAHLIFLAQPARI